MITVAADSSRAAMRPIFDLGENDVRVWTRFAYQWSRSKCAVDVYSAETLGPYDPVSGDRSPETGA